VVTLRDGIPVEAVEAIARFEQMAVGH
jgi:hypothetical protein